MSSIPRTPLTQAHFARLFFAYNFSTVNYSKIPFTPEQHITLLESRKLIISEKDRALKYISNIGYFRLSGYMYHLQKKMEHMNL